MEILKEQLLALCRNTVPGGRFDTFSSMTNLSEWTSLVHIQLLGEISHAFNVDIELEEAYRLDSFDRLFQYLQSKLVSDGAIASYPFSSIGELFEARAVENAMRPFLLFPRDDLMLNYGQCHQAANMAAVRLREKGLVRGDRLCLVLPNNPEFLLYYFAAHLCGIILVPVNPALSINEIAFIIENSGAKLALFDASMRHQFCELKSVCTSCRIELTDRESGLDYSALLANNISERISIPAIALDDTAAILYTSGTTGHPKGVVLSHRNFLADARALVEWLEFDNDTRTLCLLPMFHNNGQVITLLSPLWIGGSSVIMEGRAALMSFWKMIERYKVNWTSIMPAFLSAFLEHGLPRTDTCLKGIVCGGQILLDEVRAQFETRYGVAIFEGYGLTETTSFSSLNRFPANERKFGSIGEALSCNKMKIVDEDGSELTDGNIGEILICGENVAREYYGLPDITAQRFRDGWLHTGDYGFRDKQGHFFFSTRLDDLIIKGGENIYPAELENILHGCKDVVECAAVGVPDKILGQDIAMYIKLEEGSDFDAGTVRDYFCARIAAFKHPRYIFVLGRDVNINELPKGPTRKILRRRLREYFIEHYSPPGNDMALSYL